MPTGFDVPSGSSLSEKLVPVAMRLAEYLRKSRVANAITPERPRTGGQLCELMRLSDINVEGPAIRAMVNYLRINKYPIGSSRAGYFWANRKEELNSTLIHMMERVSAIQNAINGLERSIQEGQREFFN